MFGKCGPIFKILSPCDLQENSVCTRRKDVHLTCCMLLLPCESPRNLKMLANFHVERDVINTFN